MSRPPPAPLSNLPATTAGASGAPPPGSLVSLANGVLLVAAFHPELAPLQPVLGETMGAQVGGLRVEARAVGIGLPMAAAGAAMHLAEVRPRAVIAIGTCGAYSGSGLAIGQVVVAGSSRLVEPSVLRGASQYPEPMSVVSYTDSRLVQSIADSARARVVDVATVLAVTIDDATAGLIARESGAQVEHLETHGVATACAARGVPFTAVLAVANAVGSNARAEWRIHHRSAARAAAQAVLQWLAEGAASALGLAHP